MLPFLKRKDDSSAFSMGEEEPTQRRNPDEEEDEPEYGMLDAIAEDMLEAMGKKDKGLMRQALEALCDYVRGEDLNQDMEE